MVKFEPYFLDWWTGLYFVNFMINSNYISVCGSLACFMVFNATSNNISVISWRSVLLVEKTIDLFQVTDKLYHTVSSTSCHEHIIFQYRIKRPETELRPNPVYEVRF
jgi:hypothetical protein